MIIENKGETCPKWLHPRKFIRNNIEYRISCSKSIAAFKNSQEFILNQMAFNPYHKFTNIAKEILLLKYDIWYDYINEIEQYILCNFNLDVEVLLENIVKLSDKRADYYHNTLEVNFTSEVDIFYIEKWKEQHNYIYDFLVLEIQKLPKCNPTTIFKKIVELLNKVMNHTLYELQELDVLIYSDETPGISIDNICIHLHKKEHLFLIDKIKRYQEIRKFDSIIIKNQTSNDIELKCEIFFGELEKLGLKYSII